MLPAFSLRMRLFRATPRDPDECEPRANAGAAIVSDSSSNNTATRFICLSFTSQTEGLERSNSREKRKRPDSVPTHGARRTALPRSLLTTSLRSDLRCGNGSNVPLGQVKV